MANLKKSKEMGDFGFKVKRKKHVPKHDEGLAIWMKIKDVDRLRQIADEEEVSLTGAASLVIQFWIEHHRQKKRRPVCEEEDKDNPHSSEEDPDYQAFTVKEEASTENSDTEEFTQIVEPVDESPGEDGNLVVGWKEEGDDRADEEVPSGDPVGTIQKEDISGSSADGIDGDKRVAQTSDGGEFEVVKCFIKEEPTDSDYAEENEEDAEGGFAVMPQALGGKGSNRGALSSEHHHSGPSTSRFEPDTQGEASASGMSRLPYMMNSIQKARSTQQKTGNRSHDVRDEFHLRSELGTQLESSESSMSEYGANMVASFQEQSMVEEGTIPQDQGEVDFERPVVQGIGESIPESSVAQKGPPVSMAIPIEIPMDNQPATSNRPDKPLSPSVAIPISSISNQPATGNPPDEPLSKLHCSYCFRKLASKKGLKEHIRIHTGEKPYECTICGKRFTTFNTRKKHMKSHSDVKALHCSLCNRGFHARRDLTIHMRTHTGEKPFHCTMCDAKFARKEGLQYHMKSHTGENLFNCLFCGKGFVQKCNLTSHMRIHTGDRPFQCQICSKGFSQGSQLKRHMATHTDEKNVQCVVCNMEFTLHQHLQSHMTTHAKEMPFQCSVCGERFLEDYQLSSHVALHRGMQGIPLKAPGQYRAIQPKLPACSEQQN